VVYDAGDDEAVGPYIVSELLDGPTLRETLGHGPLARGEVARLARGLGPGLAAAHSAGLVHGNVKPDNVALTAAGPKLTGAGFGPGLDAGRRPRLPEGLAYAAPEVLEGGPVSAASDQFSLAATLYEALTGQPPFSGADENAVADAVRHRKHPAATGVLPELRACPHLDTIFDRALAKDPRRRFPACDSFSSALAGSVEAAHGRTDVPISQASIVPRATRRWQNAAAAAAVAVIFALVLVGRGPRGAGVSLKSVAGAFAMTIAASPHSPGRARPQPPAPYAPPALASTGSAAPHPTRSATAPAPESTTAPAEESPAEARDE
jgi:serine/threonine-protein kinase